MYIYIYIYIYIYVYIALWCKNQIEHSIWDESLLFCNCACSLEYSSLSTLAGLSYPICGKLEVAFTASPSSQHQHCTAEAQKAKTVLSAVRPQQGLNLDFFSEASLHNNYCKNCICKCKDHRYPKVLSNQIILTMLMTLPDNS